jgi:hypothetical protein
MTIDFDRLEFIDDPLVYYDAPILGFVKSGETTYAFRCFPIIKDKLWHWIFVPVSSFAVAPNVVIENAMENPPPLWVSLVEDSRTEVRKVHEASMTGGIPLSP